TKEYYGLSGFVQSSRRREMYIDPGGKIEAGAQTLRELQGEIEAELDEALGASLLTVREQAPALLPAAIEVLFGEPVEGEPEVARGEVFESFDGETYEAWTVEGDAFGAGPSRASEDALTGAASTA